MASSPRFGYLVGVSTHLHRTVRSMLTYNTHRPSYSWNYPSIDIPCWWQTTDDSPDGTCDATTVPDAPDAPSSGGSHPGAGWECDGSGNDGYSTDPTGATCPYDGYAGLFKYFGEGR